jgi:hypothetical protein
MIYSIWTNNGIAVDFESSAHSLNDVLDEFCKEAGYIDHADYCQQMEMTESPFNIKEVAP